MFKLYYQFISLHCLVMKFFFGFEYDILSHLINVMILTCMPRAVKLGKNFNDVRSWLKIHVHKFVLSFVIVQSSLSPCVHDKV